MHPEVEELRPRLKEILYDCAVEIRATKAALYLLNGSGRYELVTEYGFRSAVRESADAYDPIVDRCGRGKTAFYVNGVAAEPRFSEILFQASTDRLLVAPIWQRGQLVGFIDMRDKAQKLPFDQIDASKAQGIADRVVGLFANKNFFGQRFIALADQVPEPQKVVRPMSTEPANGAPAPGGGPFGVLQPPPAAPRPVKPPTGPGTQRVPGTPTEEPAVAPPQAAKLQQTAPVSSAPSDHVLQRARELTATLHSVVPGPTLGESEITAVREALKSLLLIPGLLTATLSAFSSTSGGVQETVARGVLTDEAIAGLQSKLNAWVAKRGETVANVRMNVTNHPGHTGVMLGGAQLQKVFTAPVTAGSMRGLYLTVAFTETPVRAAHESLTILHRQLEIAIEGSRTRAEVHQQRRRIAEKLLEPDFSRYPELRHHTKLVADKAEAFATFLGLTPDEIETARIVAMVHDVGLRLLDYERLYRKRGLLPEEMAYLREHARVGAALVAPLLGPEIANAVLSHHERVDGKGYPNELKGDAIPFLSRLVQICDAYVAISDPHTYQLVEPPAAALATIARGAGSQFDAQLAAKFQEMMRTR